MHYNYTSARITGQILATVADGMVENAGTGSGYRVAGSGYRVAGTG